MKGRTVQIPGVLLTIAQACHRNLTPPSAFPLQAGGGIATLCPRAGLSPASPARRKPMPSFSESLEKTLHNALKAASERHHEYATLEHLLSALIDDEHAAEVMRGRSEEHTSELQSLMRISYAVFCLKKKNDP